jgi:hypothetical protein
MLAEAADAAPSKGMENKFLMHKRREAPAAGQNGLKESRMGPAESSPD